jgi:DNA polymerase-3 subunit delta
VERWTDKQLEPLTAALKDIPPDTTIAFFAREDGRAKAPKGLRDAVKKAGGDIAAEENVKPWELPKWLIARARELDLQLEPDTARAIVAHVGDRQQRLLRELEKLAIYMDPSTPGARVDGSMVDELTAPSAEHKAWSLADTILAGDASAATALYLTLRSQGERLPGLLFWISQRVRMAHEAACALEAGVPPAQIKRTLRMPSKAADRLIADARRIGSEELQRTIEELAELELASRGGGSGGAGEDTAALLAIRRVAA